MGRFGLRRTAAEGVMLLALLGWLAPAQAQTQSSVGVPGEGHGAVTFSLGQVTADRRAVPRDLGGGLTHLGEITLRGALLEFDYGITDRLAFNALLPYKSNRYVGNTPHDPGQLLDDHGEPFLDDGSFHSGWADWGVGLRYLWLTKPVAVTPFVSFYHPLNDYPIFTGTAFGTRQWRVDLGVNFGGRVPGPLRNLYWVGGYAYSYMEETRINNSPDYRVNHSTAHFELGWFASPRLTASVAWRYRRTHDALGILDFSFPLIDDRWYYHDQLIDYEQTTVDFGLAWQISDHYVVDFNYGRTVHVELGTKIKSAYTVGVTYNF